MVAAMHAHKFYKEVAKNNFVWSIGSPEGMPITVMSNGCRVFPLWSSKTRVEKIITAVPGFAQCTIMGNTWDDFETNWVGQLQNDGVLVGVNWSGRSASGYEMPVQMLCEAVRATKRESA